MIRTKFEFCAVNAIDGSVLKPFVATSPASPAEAALVRPRAKKARPVARAGPAKPGLSLDRVFDIVLAGFLLVVLLPVLLLLAITVRATSAGPSIFGHQRVGMNGRRFTCYKFRTMYVGAEKRLERLFRKNPSLREEWLRDHKLTNDPRISIIGGFLRKSSLDELPQLYNVLIGDMSIVGPRPIIDDEVPKYGRFIQHYLSVKPGLTGLWQVSGRSCTTYRRRVACDVHYVRSKSTLSDIRILAATVPVMLTGRGAC